VALLRLAGYFNPFDQQDRGASCRFLSAAGLQNNQQDWLEAAQADCTRAVTIDYSSADMLLKLVALDLRLSKLTEAQFVYEQFKRVDPNSPVIKLIENDQHVK